MAFITADRVKDTSTTTGTGSITVSGAAPTGYRTFSTVLSAGDKFYYCVQGQTTAEWEVGLGTYTSANVFDRTTVLASSNSGSAVSFSAGTKNAYITLAASKTLQIGPSSTPVAGSVPYGTGSTLAYSAVGTSGQVLTSSGAGAPTWTTVSGTGTVTSVGVSGGSTGLTTSGGPITGSGTITISGTLAAANGGTGLTSPGTSGNVLTSNGSAWVSQAPSGGSGTSISNGTSNVTIASSNGAITAATAGTTALTIDTSQNVGIGTSSPSNKLDVSGAIRSFGSTNPFFILNDGTNNAYMQLTGSVFNFYTAQSIPMTFSTAGSERMRIDSNGVLLMGKTSSSPTTIGYEVAPTGAVTFTMASAISSQATINVYSTGAAAYRFYVDLAGTVHATNSTISAISDQRFKENVRDLNVGLNAIMALKPRAFDWKEGKGKNIKNDRGFIAQEFEQVFPDLVDEWKDPAPEGEEPYKSVRTDLTPVLVRAIQELSAKNDALEARLAKLENV